MRGRVFAHLRSNIVGYLALFVALGGTTAWAADKITSKQIAKNAVLSKHIKNGQVKSADVKDNGLKGADINEASLGQVPSAAGADHSTSADHAASADTATNAGNADNLDGQDSSSFLGASAKAADSNLVDGLDSSELVNGTGRLLHGSLTVTSPAGTPTVLALPGFGALKVNNCSPTATTSLRLAGLFLQNTSGSSVEVWSNPTAMATDHQTVANNTSSVLLAGSPSSDVQANKVILIHIFNPASGANVSGTIAQTTNNSNCLFSVQALISG
jgi:hypothetical protein